MGALIIGLVFMAIGWMVSARLKSKFREYSQIHLTRDLTGADVARLMLADNGIHDVQVTSVQGELSDHYNPATKTVNLSEGVYHGRNAAATAVAAHECGHAVQHAKAYSMLELRSALVPIQNISAKVINFLFMMMMFGAFFASQLIPWQTALLVIIACYGMEMIRKYESFAGPIILFTFVALAVSVLIESGGTIVWSPTNELTGVDM